MTQFPLSLPPFLPISLFVIIFIMLIPIKCHTKTKESQFPRVPLVYVVPVTVTLAFLGHFGQSRLTESIHLFPNDSHARLGFRPSFPPLCSLSISQLLLFFNSISLPQNSFSPSLWCSPFPCPICNSLWEYLIISFSLSLPSIALQSILGLIRKQPVLLTVTLALTLSWPCWGGSRFMPLNIFTHDLHRKLHRMLYCPRRDESTQYSGSNFILLMTVFSDRKFSKHTLKICNSTADMNQFVIPS